MYHRYLQLFNMGQILVNKTYLCRSNRRKNLTILIKINISLFYACILAHNIEETSGRTDTAGRQADRQAGTDITSSIPYVNGGTLLFSASSNKFKYVDITDLTVMQKPYSIYEPFAFFYQIFKINITLK